MKKENLKKVLFDTIDGVSGAFESLSIQSYNAMIKDLPPYSKMPARNGLHTDSAKNSFTTIRYEYHDKVNAAINEVKGAIDAARSTPPPADVSSALLLMSTRNNLTEEELQSFHNAHGHYYQVDQALMSIARDKDLHPSFASAGSKATSALSMLESIRKNVNNFIDSDDPSKAFAEFQKAWLEKDINDLPIE